MAKFQPGQSGNPKGRPKGSRNKFAEDFIDAVAQDFEVHGKAAIVNVRTNDPSTYLRVCAGIVPKDLIVTDNRDSPSAELTTAALLERIERYRTELAGRHGGAGAPGESEPEPSPIH